MKSVLQNNEHGRGYLNKKKEEEEEEKKPANNAR